MTDTKRNFKKEKSNATGDEAENEIIVTEEEQETEETSEVMKSEDIVELISEHVITGGLVKDFKMTCVLNNIMREGEEMQIGRLSRIGQLHFAIINNRDAAKVTRYLINGKLVPMPIDDFNKLAMEGVYYGSDLNLLTDNDDLLLLKTSFMLMHDGTLKIF